MTIQLATLEQTCSGCPSQWEGTTTDGRQFYARFRHGSWRVDIDGHEVAGANGFTSAYNSDGVCTFNELRQWAKNNYGLEIVAP